MSRLRSARHEEIKDHFHGVDPDILWDLYMADYCFIDSDTFELVIPDTVRMFGFMMRRLFPIPESHSDE